jgi:hypothetical protein
MCWNQQVSLNTFLFSIFALLLIMYNNYNTQYKIVELHNVWIYVFLSSFIFMQLIEFFIWRNIRDTYYNRVFSIFGVCLLIIQPICSMMILSNTKLRNILLSIYVFFTIPYSIYSFSNKNINIRSVKSKSGHLRWIFFELSPYMLLIWLFFLLFSLFYENKILGVFVGIILLLISYYNFKKDNTVGSMWCWMVNLIMIYYIIYLLIYLPFCEKKSIC